MVVFQFHHYIKPEFIEAYRIAILEDARQSVEESGILSFEVLQDRKDLTHFSLIEVYQDMDAREKHLQTPWFLKFKAAVTENQMFAKQEREKSSAWFFPFRVSNRTISFSISCLLHDTDLDLFASLTGQTDTMMILLYCLS